MTLADVRKNIDRVDKEIKQLFKERMIVDVVIAARQGCNEYQ